MKNVLEHATAHRMEDKNAESWADEESHGEKDSG